MVRLRLVKLLKETRSDTAVEFALIGSVLFLFLFGILMMGLGEFWQMALDDSVRNAARKVELGIVNAQPDFAPAVCAEFGAAAPNCSTSLGFNVQQQALFSDITPTTIATLTTSSGFPRSLTPAYATLVQVVYKLPVSLPLLPVGLMTGNGTNELVSAVSFLEQ